MEKLIKKLIRTEENVINLVREYASTGRTTLLTYINQNSINQYFDDSDYKVLLNDKFYIYNDGVGTYLALKYLFNLKPELINATDLNYKLLKVICNELRIKPYLIGGRLFLKSTFDNDLLCGYCNGYSSIKNYEQLLDKTTTDRIVIFIAMGVPKQEKIAYELSLCFDHVLIICVGNFFEYYYKRICRVPKFLRNTGIEWIFRLFTEPGRLWKRYLIGIPIFIYRIISEKLYTE